MGARIGALISAMGRLLLEPLVEEKTPGNGLGDPRRTVVKGGSSQSLRPKHGVGTVAAMLGPRRNSSRRSMQRRLTLSCLALN